MKYLKLILCVLIIASCSKKSDSVIKSANEINLESNNWNRISMKTNPIVLLPKQDGSGAFHEISDLMDLKELEGYKKNMEGFYSFKNNGIYSFTGVNPSDIKEGTYVLKSNIILATNSKGDDLNYKIIENTNEILVMELHMTFFGQETTITISCNSL